MAEETTAEAAAITLVYIGVRPDSRGTLRPAFMDMDGLTNDGNAAPGFLPTMFKRGAFGRMFVGFVYEFQGTRGADGLASIVANKKRMAGHWRNDSDRTEWQTIDRAYQIERSMESKAKALNLAKDLAPVRRAYRQANSTMRAAILAAVIETITGGL